jgi:hypothetical protein
MQMNPAADIDCDARVWYIRLMQHARRLLRWLLFVGCFTAIGVGVFHFVRYSPRCVIEGSFGHCGISADGSRLLTLGRQPELKIDPVDGTIGPVVTGPLQVWSTYSGDLLSHRWEGIESIDSIPIDNDHVALKTPHTPISILNWCTGDEWFTDVDESLVYFPSAGRGRWLCAGGGDVLIDTVRRTWRRGLGGTPHISGNGQILAVRRRGTNEVAVRHLTEEREVGVLKISSADSLLHISPCGRWLLEHDRIVNLSEAKPGESYQIDLWDLQKLERRLHLELPKTGRLHAQYYGDGRYLTLFVEKKDRQRDFHLVDLEAGHILWKQKIVYLAQHCHFAPDNSTCAILHDDNEDRLIMMEVSSGRVFWERQGVIPWYIDSARVLLLPIAEDARAEIVDVKTGRTTGPRLDELALPMLYHPVLETSDRRHCLIHGERLEPAGRFEAWLEKYLPKLFKPGKADAFVLDAVNLKILYRVSCPTNLFMLTNDASTLVSTEMEGPDMTIRIYDVHPARAWRWAIGVALGSAIVWQFGVQRAWRFVKRRRSAAKAQPPVGTSGR